MADITVSLNATKTTSDGAQLTTTTTTKRLPISPVVSAQLPMVAPQKFTVPASDNTDGAGGPRDSFNNHSNGHVTSPSSACPTSTPPLPASHPPGLGPTLSSLGTRRLSFSSMSSPSPSYTSPMTRRFSFSMSSSLDLGGGAEDSLRRSQLSRSMSTFGDVRHEETPLEQLERRRREEISRRLREIRASAPSPTSKASTGRRQRLPTAGDVDDLIRADTNNSPQTVKQIPALPTIVRGPGKLTGSRLPQSMSAMQLRTRRDVASGNQPTSPGGWPTISGSTGPMRANWSINMTTFDRSTSGGSTSSTMSDISGGGGDETNNVFTYKRTLSTNSNEEQKEESKNKVTFTVGNANLGLVHSRWAKRERTKQDVNNNICQNQTSPPVVNDAPLTIQETSGNDDVSRHQTSDIHSVIDDSIKKETKPAVVFSQFTSEVRRCEPRSIENVAVVTVNEDSVVDNGFLQDRHHGCPIDDLQGLQFEASSGTFCSKSRQPEQLHNMDQSGATNEPAEGGRVNNNSNGTNQMASSPKEKSSCDTEGHQRRHRLLDHVELDVDDSAINTQQGIRPKEDEKGEKVSQSVTLEVSNDVSDSRHAEDFSPSKDYVSCFGVDRQRSGSETPISHCNVVDDKMLKASQAHDRHVIREYENQHDEECTEGHQPQVSCSTHQSDNLSEVDDNKSSADRHSIKDAKPTKEDISLHPLHLHLHQKQQPVDLTPPDPPSANDSSPYAIQPPSLHEDIHTNNDDLNDRKTVCVQNGNISVHFSGSADNHDVEKTDTVRQPVLSSKQSAVAVIAADSFDDVKSVNVKSDSSVSTARIENDVEKSDTTLMDQSNVKGGAKAASVDVSTTRRTDVQVAVTVTVIDVSRKSVEDYQTKLSDDDVVKLSNGCPGNRPSDMAAAASSTVVVDRKEDKSPTIGTTSGHVSDSIENNSNHNHGTGAEEACSCSNSPQTSDQPQQSLFVSVSNGDIVKQIKAHRHNDDGEDSNEDRDVDGYKVINFDLIKDCVGLGFCLEGGDPNTERLARKVPIRIKRFFKGDTWAKGYLQAGDELLRVNGTSFAAMKHDEAWAYLKALPDGRVSMKIRRKV